jgi:alpha-tubulin suppressor-like RCC1 family protein
MGAVACSGDGSAGQLGDGVTGAIRAPIQVVHPQNATWSSVDAGDEYTCALDADRVVHCWGDNVFGSIGDGTYLRRLVPVAINGGSANWSDLTAGSDHACARDAIGNLWCWGADNGGSLGDNSTQQRNTPVPIAGTFSAVSAGNHTCGIDPMNKAWCWGSNSDGQLGHGGTTRRLVPTVVTTGTYKSISTSFEHTCAIEDTTSYVWCWGAADRGQAGTGMSAALYDTPTQTAGGFAYSSVFAGPYRTCAISTANQTYCWGANYYGALGTAATNQPSLIIDSGQWVTLALGYQHTCGLWSDSSLRCWGRNDRGQLGDGTQSTRPMSARIGTSAWTQVASGNDHVCGIQLDGTLWCWGSNRDGQLGTGTSWTKKWVVAP